MIKTVADFPAYEVIDMNLPVIDVTAQDAETQEFCRPQVTKRHGTLYSMLKLGSVSLSARRYGDDELAAVKRAKELGHPLYFAFNLGSMIHSGPVVKTTKVLLKEGQRIRLDGTLVEVRYERDIYINLVPVEPAIVPFPGIVPTDLDETEIQD
jgi:hypothetical protein